MTSLTSGVESDLSSVSLSISMPSNGLKQETSSLNDERQKKENLSSSFLINRISLQKLSEERRAKRCRFFRNGDQWFPGTVVAIGGDKHRTWEALLEDLTRILDHPQHLAAGVRHLFTLNGKKLNNLESLLEGSEYVASSTESLKNIDYQKLKLPQWRINVKRKEALHVHSKNSPLNNTNSNQSSGNYIHILPLVESYKEFIKPKLITVVRNGVRPRKAVRILLNHRTARSFEQVLDDITDVIKLDTGAVRKIFSISGKQLTSLKEFFNGDDIFFAYGSEKHYIDDFVLEPEEMRLIQPLMKGTSPRRNRMSSPQSRLVRPHSPSSPYVNSTGSLSRTRRLDRPSRTPRRKVVSINNEANGHVDRNHTEKEFYPCDVSSKYKVGEMLGDGNFAVVKHCTNVTSGRQFALKVIDKAQCKGKEQMIESEVSILRKISHPNVVGLIEEFENRDYLYLVLEFVPGGDLFDAIASATKYTENETKRMLIDVTSALFYLHERSIVHRDIKPENLLVYTKDEETRLKVGDFGLAVQFSEPLYTVCGTPTYVAPEILTETGYGLEVDIWAVGVITYILMCGFPPFVSITGDEEELFDFILRGKYEFHSPYWDSISYAAKELITNMIRVDPSKRFTALQVLDHFWVNSLTVSKNKRKSVNGHTAEDNNQLNVSN